MSAPIRLPEGLSANPIRRPATRRARAVPGQFPQGGRPGVAIATRLACLTSLVAIGLLVLAGPASADSSWWQVTSGTRPAEIDPAHGHPGAPEIQQITVGTEASEGNPEQAIIELSAGGTELGFWATEPSAAKFGLTPLTAAELETVLSPVYGGEVEVEEESAGATLTFTITSSQGAPLAAGEAGPPGHNVHASVLDPGSPAVPDGEIYLTVENLGNQSVGEQSFAGAVQIKDTLPAGLKAVGIAATKPPIGGEVIRRVPLVCELESLTCLLEEKDPEGGIDNALRERIAPYDQLEVRIGVDVEPGAQSGEANQVTVSGGQGFSCASVGGETGQFSDPGCAAVPQAGPYERSWGQPVPSASLSRRVTIGGGPAPGVEAYELRNEEEGGSPARQAGSHPFQSTTTIFLNQTADSRPVESTNHKPAVNPIGLPKDLHFKWPPGMIGNPTSAPTCSPAQFFKPAAQISGNFCPAQSAVGVATVMVNEPATAGVADLTVPLFNLERKQGEPARFGFNVTAANTPVVIDTALRSDGDYGVTVETNNITQTAALLASTVTVWGVPGDPSHNQQRGWTCLLKARGFTAGEEGIPNCDATAAGNEAHPPAFLTLPTSCTLGAGSTVLGDTWAEPLGESEFPELASTAFPAFEGCSLLQFAPEIAAEPTTRSASSPSGLSFDLNFANEGLESASGRSESAVKRVTVALPKGVTTNPAVATGLTACALGQYEAEALDNQSCPESSKVGEVEIESPLVDESVDGSIYIAKAHENPADNLLSIYMVAKNPSLGVLIRSAGAITPDPQSGQLSTTFDQLPQLPFRHFHLSFPGGNRAPLITPGLCGTYSTQADLYPYANPAVPVHREASFTITSGADGAPCASEESQLPNDPSLEAGTTTPIAGAYSPFVFRVSRRDGSQPLSRISATLPEGLLGKLAGIPYCSEAQISQAEARSGEGQGAAELTSPSCPAPSQVGVVTAGTGAGPQPYYVQGKAYLAGPFKGAPLSLAIITPAVVGPFDLGNVVIRTALRVDQATAQITAVSDPIPAILHGLPTVLRSVSLNMNRPDFTLNPTSCEPMSILGSATSTLGAVAPLSERFQVGACGGLGFKPDLKLRLKGSVKRTANPKLIADLTYPKQGAYSNIARAQVKLPPSAFLDNAHIGTICTRPQFAAHACPPGSVYGKAKAVSPLLDKPLSGNVYLRANPAHKLPDLVADLNGQIEVALAGKTDSVKGALRNTFEAVPDAPVSSFHLELFGGKRGLIEMSAGFCKKPRATVKLTAHNGKTYDTDPVVKSSCGKGATGPRKSAAHRRDAY